jgi:hypothetical protein
VQWPWEEAKERWRAHKGDKKAIRRLAQKKRWRQKGLSVRVMDAKLEAKRAQRRLDAENERLERERLDFLAAEEAAEARRKAEEEERANRRSSEESVDIGLMDMEDDDDDGATQPSASVVLGQNSVAMTMSGVNSIVLRGSSDAIRWVHSPTAAAAKNPLVTSPVGPSSMP